MPWLSALNVNCDWCPGAVKLEAAPPPGPVTPCRSMLCGILLSGWFLRWNSTVSPWRTRMKLPGTVPPKVQNVYFTPAAISRSTSRTSSFTMTLAGAWRPVGGGTRGGLVSTAFTGSPCGGPESPEREPPVSAGAAAGGEFWLQAASGAAAGGKVGLQPRSRAAARATSRVYNAGGARGGRREGIVLPRGWYAP